MLGWTRRGVGASERTVVVECNAGKTYMSYTKNERAGVGGGNNGQRAGERERARLRLLVVWGEAVPSMLMLVKRGMNYRCRCRRRRRRDNSRRRGGRRIIQ